MDEYLGIIAPKVKEYIKRGKPEEINYIIMCYYPLAIKIVDTFDLSFDQKEEYIQVAMLSVVESVTSYPFLKKKLTDYVRENIIIAIKQYRNRDFLGDRFGIVQKKLNDLEEFLKRKPSTKEILNALSQTEMESFIKMGDPLISSLTSEELENDYLKQEIIAEIFSLINNYDDESKYIFCSYFGVFGYSLHSLEEIKNKTNLNGHKILKIIRNILIDIKKSLDIKVQNGLKK